MDDPASLSSFFLFATEPISAPDAGLDAWSVFGIFIVIVLVLANGFFVASEFALVAVRRSRIEALAADGDASAARLVGMLNNLNAYISATQLGITLSSLGLGWIGEPAVAEIIRPALTYFGELTGATVLTAPTVVATIAFAIAFSLITFLHIVFGELAPKTAALELAERVSFIVAIPLQVFYRIFYYPIRLLDWAGTTTVRLLGLEPSGEHGSSYTEDEIRQLIRSSQASGHLNEEEQKLIDQVFEFSDTTVKEAMVPRTEIVAIPRTHSLDEIAVTFREHGLSRIPLYGESLDDILGLIHVKDVLTAVTLRKDFRLEDILQKPNYVVDTARLEDVLRQMQQEKFHFGFVVDEHGGVEGIITLEDLLEEIVGEISDEHDEEVNEQIHPQPDGSYLLDGAVAVRDLNKRLDINLPISDGYTTLGGFLMSEAGQILSTGDKVEFSGYVFLVEKAEKRRVLSVRLAMEREEAEQTPGSRE